MRSVAARRAVARLAHRPLPHADSSPETDCDLSGGLAFGGGLRALLSGSDFRDSIALKPAPAVVHRDVGQVQVFGVRFRSRRSADALSTVYDRDLKLTFRKDSLSVLGEPSRVSGEQWPTRSGAQFPVKQPNATGDRWGIFDDGIFYSSVSDVVDRIISLEWVVTVRTGSVFGIEIAIDCVELMFDVYVLPPTEQNLTGRSTSAIAAPQTTVATEGQRVQRNETQSTAPAKANAPPSRMDFLSLS